METTPASELPHFDSHEFKEFYAGLDKGTMQPKDRLKRVKATLANYQYSCAQAEQVTKLVPDMGAQMMISIYPNIHDKKKFGECLKSTFKWQEDKDDVLKATEWKLKDYE